MIGDREENCQSPVPALGESPTQTLEQMTGCGLAQLKSAGAGVPAEHGSQSLLGKVVVLFNGVGELVGRSGEDLQFQAGTRRLQDQFQAASSRQAAAASINQSAQHGLQSPWIAQYVRKSTFQVQFEMQTTTLKLLFPSRCQQIQHASEVGACQC